MEKNEVGVMVGMLGFVIAFIVGLLVTYGGVGWTTALGMFLGVFGVVIPSVIGVFGFVYALMETF